MKKLFYLLLMCGTMAGAQAQSNAPAWEWAGWGGGGFFFSAVFHPSKDGVLYMGGDVAGVYKSEDHGGHWRLVNSGLASYAIYSLAVDRTAPDTVFAATEEGLCKSTNGGEQWRVLPNTGRKELRITGERMKSIRAIAVDPTDARQLKQRQHQSIHPHRPILGECKKFFRLDVEIRIAAFQQGQEAIDHSQRLPQIVRGNVSELLQFYVGLGEFQGLDLHFTLNHLAIGNVADNPGEI